MYKLAKYLALGHYNKVDLKPKFYCISKNVFLNVVFRFYRLYELNYKRN